MAFLRSKIINGKEYFYLVENRRENKKVRQKVIKYIGDRKKVAGILSKIYEKKNLR